MSESLLGMICAEFLTRFLSHRIVVSCGKNNAMFTIPNITANGWYRPSKMGWFITVLTILEGIGGFEKSLAQHFSGEKQPVSGPNSPKVIPMTESPPAHSWVIYIYRIWRFPEIGVPLSHPFIAGIFHEIDHPAIGVPPMAMETPIYPSNLWNPVLWGSLTTYVLGRKGTFVWKNTWFPMSIFQLLVPSGNQLHGVLENPAAIVWFSSYEPPFQFLDFPYCSIVSQDFTCYKLPFAQIIFRDFPLISQL